MDEDPGEKMKGRLLLIFDLNGTLLMRTKKKVENSTISAIKVLKYYAYYRPHLETFLSKLNEKKDIIDVGIWTSAMQENAEALCSHLAIQPKFILNQSHCMKVGRDPVNWFKPLFIKELDSLYALHNCYNNSNTIIFDDSALKFQRNAQNGILVPEFTFPDEKDSVLLTLTEWIDNCTNQWKEGLALESIMENKPNFML